MSSADTGSRTPMNVPDNDFITRAFLAALASCQAAHSHGNDYAIALQEFEEEEQQQQQQQAAQEQLLAADGSVKHTPGAEEQSPSLAVPARQQLQTQLKQQQPDVQQQQPQMQQLQAVRAVQPAAAYTAAAQAACRASRHVAMAQQQVTLQHSSHHPHQGPLLDGPVRGPRVAQQQQQRPRAHSQPEHVHQAYQAAAAAQGGAASSCWSLSQPGIWLPLPVPPPPLPPPAPPLPPAFLALPLQPACAASAGATCCVCGRYGGADSSVQS